MVAEEEELLASIRSKANGSSTCASDALVSWPLAWLLDCTQHTHTTLRRCRGSRPEDTVDDHSPIMAMRRCGDEQAVSR